MCKNKTINSFILIIIGIAIALLFAACSSDENNPTESTNDTDVIGVWKEISRSWTTSYDSGSYSQSQLDSLGNVWELTFNLDNTALQVKSLGDSLTTKTGTWAISGDQLTLTLKTTTPDEVGVICYKCDVANNVLNLCWTISIGTEFSSEFAKQ